MSCGRFVGRGGAHLVAAPPPPAPGFLRLEGPLTFSCLKPADDGTPREVILRILNLSAAPADGKAVFARPFRSAAPCQLDETAAGAPAAQNSCELPIHAEPWKFVTFAIQF